MSTRDSHEEKADSVDEDTVKVMVYYFAETRGTIYGTPLVPVEMEVSPSLDVGSLKYMVCYAAGLIEDMMALMLPKKPTPEEHDYFSARGNLVIPSGLNSTILTDIFTMRRLKESLKVGELDTRSLAMCIDINWLKKCPVCGHENHFSNPSGVSGLDNISDLHADYTCSNSGCNEHNVRKHFDIRVARWLAEEGTGKVMPLLTSIINTVSRGCIYGSKTNPSLAVSGYCNCGAKTPADAHYCWNCGKTNRNGQPKPPIQLPYDLDALRRRVTVQEEKRQSETIRASVEFVEELMRRGAIVEITYCERCGAQNNVSAVRCQYCGGRLSSNRSKKKQETGSEPDSEGEI